MGLLELASNDSFWRGVDYYEQGNKKVCVFIKQTRTQRSATLADDR